MKIRLRLIFIGIISIIFSTCSPNRFLDKRAKQLGTTGKNNWSFHRLSDRDKGTLLAFPGYVIAIEKSYRKKTGAPSLDALKNQEALKIFGFKSEVYEWFSMPKDKRWILNDGKPTFISSIFKFEFNDSTEIPFINNSTLYDAYYHKFLPDPKNAYAVGFSELMKLKEKLSADIIENDITHVFVYAMGWNTDQQEAIRNFNSLHLKILQRSSGFKNDFRPLFIGLTWPSLWPIPVLSLFNKTNDADEIGMIWGNILINTILGELKDLQNFKTVVIGHSLGAKLTSRAVMSASMLEKQYDKVDLLINLESAYSINRYSMKKHIESTPDYREWKKYVENIALIWSEKDAATKIAIWAPYAGASSGYRKVKNNPGDFPSIKTFKYRIEDGIRFTSGDQFLMINGTAIINTKAYNKGGNAHSDIYNDQVADLLLNLIESGTF